MLPLSLKEIWNRLIAHTSSERWLQTKHNGLDSQFYAIFGNSQTRSGAGQSPLPVGP